MLALSVLTLVLVSQTPDWVADGPTDGSKFGWSVASAGDVNNDGYDDVIVGSWWYSGGQTLQGRADVYLGSATGLATSSVWHYEPGVAGVGFGVSVSGAGDVNGDGFDDVLVGADEWSNPEHWEGKVFLFYGSNSGPSTAPDWGFESNSLDARLSTVARAGDINGDGYDDVVVGAFQYSGTAVKEGRAYVFLGSPTIPTPASPPFLDGGTARRRVLWCYCGCG